VRVRAQIEERFTEAVVATKRERDLEHAREQRGIAAAREKERAELFSELLEGAMGAALEDLEGELFDDELWQGTHEVADRWHDRSEAVAHAVWDQQVDEQVESLITQHCDALLAEEWADLCVDDILLDEVLAALLHREMGSKMLVEAALGHGLIHDSPTKPPRKPHHAGQLLALGVDEPPDADFVAAASKLQGMWRARTARRAMRKLLVKAWRKRWDDESQCYYYENVHNGEMTWEPPACFYRYFPDVEW